MVGLCPYFYTLADFGIGMAAGLALEARLYPPGEGGAPLAAP